ncbi:MAG: preprotein translocase subunit SecA [Planctomycetota bacterium]
MTFTEKLGKMVGDTLGRIFGTPSDKVIKSLNPFVTHINKIEPYYAKLNDAQLLAKTAEFRARFDQVREALPKATPDNLYIAYKKVMDEILCDAFATVREAAKRALGMRHYDVQLIGGMVLHKGMISEMITGEGKTLVATLPSYLNALPRKEGEYSHTHVITVNDYLAKRDAAHVAKIFSLLGLTVGAIQSQMDSPDRHRQYACDITYGTASEFGFDYLRDNMKLDPADQVQKVRNFVIIDEVDSILIDEARTPLIISGGHDRRLINRYVIAARMAESMKPVPEEEVDRITKLQLEGDHGAQPTVGDYIVDEKDHTCAMTPIGIRAAEAFLTRERILQAGESYYHPRYRIWPHLIDNALKAKELYLRGEKYEVTLDRDQRTGVVIVDTSTGRLMHGRRWSDGLHQAVEAKEILRGEKIEIEGESQTLATVTLQNFALLYRKLSGMTGTAMTEANEFGKVYKLECISIPPNRPLKRTSFPDIIYAETDYKLAAIVDEIKFYTKLGRPVLVGTTSVEKSEILSNKLDLGGLKNQYEVLNAKNHQREAAIVAQAGKLGAITVATNMAGRGTDILLQNFSTEDLLEYWKKHGLAPAEAQADWPKEKLEFQLAHTWAKEFLDKDFPRDTPLEKIQEELHGFWKTLKMPDLKLCHSVRELGGLHIIGTERHEARRIDNQWRGRAGRQGDPGSSRFFLCLDDDLMRIFARDWVRKTFKRLGLEKDTALETRFVSGRIETAQRRVEERNFAVRKRLLEYDEISNDMRKLIYKIRQDVLEGVQVRETMTQWIEDIIALNVGKIWVESFPSEIEVEFAVEQLISRYAPLTVDDEFDPTKLEAVYDETRDPGEGPTPEAAAEAAKAAEAAEAAEAEGAAPADGAPDKPADAAPGTTAKPATGAVAKTGPAADAAAKPAGSEKKSGAAKTAKPGAADDDDENADGHPGVDYAALVEAVRRQFELTIDAAALKRVPRADLPSNLISAINEHFGTLDINKVRALKLAAWLEKQFNIQFDPKQIEAELLEKAQPIVEAAVMAEYNRREEELGEEQLPAEGATRDPETGAWSETRAEKRLNLMQRLLMLEIMDNHWKEHLRNLDALREGIHFRQVAQRDPKFEYKREASELFVNMMIAMKKEATELIFHMPLIQQEEALDIKLEESFTNITTTHTETSGFSVTADLDQPAPVTRAEMNAAAEHGGASVRAVETLSHSDVPEPRPNDRCPCNSGKKYKKCHGRPGMPPLTPRQLQDWQMEQIKLRRDSRRVG